MLNEDIQNRLDDRSKKGTYRSLSCYGDSIDLLSNDFLGLAKTAEEQTVLSGSTGSRLISGNSAYVEEVERELANFFVSESALFFNSGYLANLSLFSSLPTKDCIVVYDKDVHASVRDGISMGKASSVGFRHNDCEDLERLLKKLRKANTLTTILVAVEALYSMSGGLAPLVKIAELCKEYSADLIVDEAHSGGVYGQSGKGLVVELGLEHKIFARLITFGKAYGTHGAIVLGSEALRSFLINFARPFIYTTAVSEAEARHILNNVHRSLDDSLRKSLDANIKRFRIGINAELISDSRSPIQVIRKEVPALAEIEGKLIGNGIAAKTIYPPTVKKGEECLRIVLHAFNTEEEIDRLIRILNA